MRQHRVFGLIVLAATSTARALSYDVIASPTISNGDINYAAAGEAVDDEANLFTGASNYTNSLVTNGASYGVAYGTDGTYQVGYEDTPFGILRVSMERECIIQREFKPCWLFSL